MKPNQIIVGQIYKIDPKKETNYQFLNTRYLGCQDENGKKFLIIVKDKWEAGHPVLSPERCAWDIWGVLIPVKSKKV